MRLDKSTSKSSRSATATATATWRVLGKNTNAKSNICFKAFVVCDVDRCAICMATDRSLSKRKLYLYILPCVTTATPYGSRPSFI